MEKRVEIRGKGWQHLNLTDTITKNVPVQLLLENPEINLNKQIEYKSSSVYRIGVYTCTKTTTIKIQKNLHRPIYIVSYITEAECNVR